MHPGNHSLGDLAALNHTVIHCQRCPRLVSHRQQVAEKKKRAYQDEDYWGRPVPGWGDRQASLLVLGLAPGAHGANRTGLPFGGDSSGRVLLSALQRAGYVEAADGHPDSPDQHRDFQLHNVYLSNVVRCVPPGNLPAAQERDNCLPYLAQEIRLLKNLTVILALGGYAFRTLLRCLQEMNVSIPRPRPNFNHGITLQLAPYTLIASYHPSRRNTQTGLLTTEMLDSVIFECQRMEKRHGN